MINRINSFISCCRIFFLGTSFFVITLLMAACGGSSGDKSDDTGSTTPSTAEVTSNNSSTIPLSNTSDIQAETDNQAQQNEVVQSNQVPQSIQPPQAPSDSSNNPNNQQPATEPSGNQSTQSIQPPQAPSNNSNQSNQDNQATTNNQEPITSTPELSDNQDVASNQGANKTKRILPLGDSITNGGDGFPSYRRRLWFMLRNGDYDVDFIGSQRGFDGPVDSALKDFDLDHEGHWAWEAGELEQSLPDWISGYTPDIVLLHAGTNDVDRGQSHGSTISELDGIVDILRGKNPNVVILLAKIIPMQNRDTADFNEFIELFAASKHTSASPVVIVDQHTGYSPSTDNHDNYHPNDRGEEKMATRWLNALQPYLN